MRKITGAAKTVRDLLKDVKYTIDYYQREYKWGEKHVRELLDDLVGAFLEEHDPANERQKVADYPHYFLGSIIVSRKLQQNLPEADRVPIDDLIFSISYGQKSFNIHVEERTPCMEALYMDDPFDDQECSESVKNLFTRYQELERTFPEELQGPNLPYFIDWLLENVHMVEITTYSDEDAYLVFETMNDRGLSLSPTEMLKGYLLSSMEDPMKREKANHFWRERVLQLNQAGKDVESDFFKAWFRSQYSQKIRERRKGARPEDFDRIGTEFHRWLREASDYVGLHQADDFYQFIDKDFRFYSRQYLRLVKATRNLVKGLEHVLYNAQDGFTLQFLLLLAPLKPSDDEKTVLKKIRLVAQFVDILLAWRVWNFRSTAYSTMQYAMFLVMRSIRGLEVEPLARKLHQILMMEEETFAANDRLRLHQRNRYYLHRLLARITDYVETQSGLPSRYLEYVSGGKTRFEVEHIWADHPERHTMDFSHPADFAEYRNRIGGLLLLPKSANASYGDLVYTEKLKYYFKENLLARSLHPDCYKRNPGFVDFVKKSGLPFKPHPQFGKDDLEERSLLYRKIAERIWNPEDLLNQR